MGNSIHAMKPLLITSLSSNYSENKLLELIQKLKYRMSPCPIDDPIIELLEIKDQKLVPLLIEALKSQEHNIRFGAVRALGILEDKRAIVPLIELLKDEDRYVRATAANALKRFKDIRAVKPLIECLNDEASEVSRSAAITLGWIDSKEAIDALKNLVANKNQGNKTTQIAAEAMLRRLNTTI